MDNLKIFLGGIFGHFDTETVRNSIRHLVHRDFFVDVPKRKFNQHQEERNIGFAVIQLTSPEDYNKIFEQGEVTINNRIITPKPYLKGPKLEKHLEQEDTKKVCLVNVPIFLKTEIIKNSVEVKFGALDDAYRLVHPLTREPQTKVYCFFKSSKNALKLIKMKKIKIGIYEIDCQAFGKPNKRKKKTFDNKKKPCLLKDISSGLFLNSDNNKKKRSSNQQLNSWKMRESDELPPYIIPTNSDYFTKSRTALTRFNHKLVGNLEFRSWDPKLNGRDWLRKISEKLENWPSNNLF